VWSYSSYEAVGQIVEEVKDANKNLRRSLLGAVFLATFSYVISLTGCFGLDRDWGEWEEGDFVDFAQVLGGPILKYIVSVATMAATFGSFTSLMLTASQEMCEMGQKELLGIKFLRFKHPRFDTPWTAIAIEGIGAGLFSILPFIDLIYLNNVLYCMEVFLIYASLIRLRYTYPNMLRPIPISKSNWVAIAVVVAPLIVVFYIIGWSFFQSWWQATCAFGAYFMFAVLYRILVFVRGKVGGDEEQHVNRPYTLVTQSINTQQIQEP